jgi:hypothetical protein
MELDGDDSKNIYQKFISPKDGFSVLIWPSSNNVKGAKQLIKKSIVEIVKNR